MATNIESAENITFSECAVHTISQLHYLIEKAPYAIQLYLDFSWNILKSMEIDGIQISLVETKSWAFVSHFFLNRGYRIIARCKSRNELVLLHEEDNSTSGRQNVFRQWKKVEGVSSRCNIIEHLLTMREWGYYQQPTAVITGPKSLEGEPSIEFYQTIYYGTDRERGSDKSPELFYKNDDGKTSSLHVGVAQCAIPSKRFLDRAGTTYVGPALERSLPERINFISEMELDTFIKYFTKKYVNNCYLSYLRYLRSANSTIESTFISKEDTTAIRKALVDDLVQKFYSSSDEEKKDLQKYENKLNQAEKAYFYALKILETRLRDPPENQNQDILLFIHGFNNTFDSAILRASKLACDIGFAGRLAVFSWPSLGGVLNYMLDSTHQVQAALPKLLKFLPILCQGARKVHIIAHSLGASLVSKLGPYANKLQQTCKGKIGQVILGHGDVTIETFKQAYDGKEYAGLKDIAENITLYYQQHDRALYLSCVIPLIGKGEKIGRQCDDRLSNADELDNIDISKLPVDTIGLRHATFLESALVLEDMSEIIHTGTRAHYRKNIQVSCRCGKITDLCKNCHSYQYFL